MTNEEAIKELNALNAVCGQKDFYDSKFEEALGLAIRALEKQRSKKKNNKVVYSHDSYAYCPHCGIGIVSAFIMRPSLCPKCHGELDW